ncbi:hypothetical protein CRG98_048985, partial [Punica granatum]
MESPEENLTGRFGDESDGEDSEWRVGDERRPTEKSYGHRKPEAD